MCIISSNVTPGLDDLRDWTNNVQPHIPIYVADRDFEVKDSFLPSVEHQLKVVDTAFETTNIYL